jgi:hypothetical protein
MRKIGRDGDEGFGTNPVVPDKRSAIRDPYAAADVVCWMVDGLPSRIAAAAYGPLRRS